MPHRPVPTPLSRRAALLGATAVGVSLGAAGCAPLERLPAVPAARRTEATVLGLPNERFFPTTAEGQTGLEREFVAAVERLNISRGGRPGGPMPQLDLLGISGGGDDGAFGAGVLNGWTERGGRPEFFLVTGVSTGALSAPFAFLGPAWDGALKSVYTDITLAQVARERFLTAAYFSDGMADNTPLFDTISRYLDERMLAEIGAAYTRGRLLLIGSTNLDADRPVIWNVGAIAASGHPRALDTIRRLLLASAAIPGAFSPVLFDVTVDGERFQELHVDGGAFAQVFLYPASVGNLRRERMARRLPTAPARAWVIRNARLESPGGQVERRTIGVAGRAVSAMIFASGYSDVFRIYSATQRDHVGFNLAFIGSDFELPYVGPFSQAYMRPLFEYGRQRALAGTAWVDRPPA
ncbi:MAG: patatin-like phospholipase family protein [Rubritepida sp.]|nr:patatin-like phospholipase family protein [Rubritepida sp.]